MNNLELNDITWLYVAPYVKSAQLFLQMEFYNDSLLDM